MVASLPSGLQSQFQQQFLDWFVGLIRSADDNGLLMDDPIDTWVSYNLILIRCFWFFRHSKNLKI